MKPTKNKKKRHNHQPRHGAPPPIEAIRRQEGPVSPEAEPNSSEPHRAGFVSIAGRPNAGKSTLLNALIGEKMAITAYQAQTTRTSIQGVYTSPDIQIVFIDTPGIHK